MPIALIVIVVIAIAAATGFWVSQNTDVAVDSELMAETIERTEEMVTPEEAESEAAVEMEADAEIQATLPADPVDQDDPAVSGVNEDLVAPTTSVNEYADGVYTAEASYFTPSNVKHDISVTLTLEGDEVADAAVLYDGGAAETSSHTRFENALAPEVIGVDLEDVSLSRVGGASLTSDAFNEAVDTIKQQASA